MAWPGTVEDNKGLAQGYQSLLLVAITLQGTSTPVLLCTHDLDGVNGPTFPGIGEMPAGSYKGRLLSQDPDAIQWRSAEGIDRLTKFAITVNDADGFYYNNICKVYGFRGGSMVVGHVLWEAGTSNFSTNAPVKFRGVCDMERPQRGLTQIVVTANTAHNMAVIRQPSFILGKRCPLYFPKNAQERALTVLPDSDWCPYSADITGGVGNHGPANHVNSYGEQVTDASGVFIMCDYIRSNDLDNTSGCMARLGHAAITTVAPDGDIEHDISGRPTGAFAGIQWSPGTYYAIAKNYTSNSKIPIFSFLNSSILGQYASLVYGTQMVTLKPTNVVESGNDTKCEAIACAGNIGQAGVILVIVNGIVLNRNPSGDNNLWWDFVNTGGRFGHLNTDTGYRDDHHSALGDPYGSLATLRLVFYKDIFTGFGVPTPQAIISGPALWVYAPISSLTGSGGSVTVTLPTGRINPWIGGAGTVRVFGNSLGGANGDFTATGAAFGPPGTVTYACSATGSGAGGYIGYESSLSKSNPAFVLLDLLRRCRWNLQSEVDLGTFYDMALWCRTPVDYINQTGDAVQHERFKCCFAQESQRTAAEIVAAVLRGFSGYLYNDETTGLLCLGIAQTLADQQPTLPVGSNYTSAVSSIHVDGSAGTGYLAYLFDESNIARVGDGVNVRLDIEAVENATVMTPNQVFAQFQDEDNQYSQDSIGEIDTDAVARAGGASNPGGALVPETLVILGPPNFDQLSRVINQYIAERQFGNEDNDARGTRIFDIGATTDVSHLHTGSLVGLSLVKYGLSVQLFRVLKITPSTDYENARVLIQWENEIWRTDVYGQAPQSFHSNAGTNRPARIPLPWQADAETPNSTIFPATERNFQITEIDEVEGNGNLLVSVQVSGKATINQINSTTQPPMVPLQASTTPTGGSIRGGVTYLIEICAFDSNGEYTNRSNMIVAAVPSGTNTNTITVDGLGWFFGTAGYDVFVGTDSFNITFQKTWDGTTANPSSITLTSIPNVSRYGPPDLNADTMELIGKAVAHAGIVGSAVVSATASPNHVTIGSPATGSLGSVAGRKLMLLGRPNLEGAPLPIIDFTILSNTGSVLTVDRDPSSLLHINDVVVISLQCTTATLSSITDALLVNAFAPVGVSPTTDKGKLVRIIAGTGRYQVRTISSVTESTVGAGYDTYNMSQDWDVLPDTTSIFIVEDSSWRYSSSDTQIRASEYVSSPLATLNFSNLHAQCVLVQALIVDPSGNLYSSAYRSPFRMMWMFGVQGTRNVVADGITNPYPVTQFITDGKVLCDATLGNIVYQCLSFALIPNQMLIWEKTDVSTHTVTIQSAAGELFSNNSNQIILVSRGDSSTVVFDGN